MKNTKIKVRVTSMSVLDRPAVAVPGQEPVTAPLFQVNFDAVERSQGINHNTISLVVDDLGTLKPGQIGELTFAPDVA